MKKWILSRRIVTITSLVGFIALMLLAATPPPQMFLNAWTTNKSVLPVFGDNNLAISNRIAGPGGGTNWNFYGIGPSTVARLKDITNAGAGIFVLKNNGSATGLLTVENQTNSGTIDSLGVITAYDDMVIKGGLVPESGGTMAGPFKYTGLTANKLLTLDGTQIMSSSAYSDSDIAALQAATNGVFVRIQNGVANSTTLTNSFYNVGTSNFYQQFFPTTTNTGGILDQRAPFSFVQFANNAVFTDPHQDVQTIHGYNIGSAGSQVNTNEPGLSQTFESNFQNFNNLIQSEWYWTYLWPYTNGSLRFLSFNFQRSTNTLPSQVLNASANINGNITADAFNFYSPYASQAGGFTVTASSDGTTLPTRVTLEVFGLLNIHTNSGNNGGITVQGGTVQFLNRARDKSTYLITGYPGDGLGIAAQDGNFVFYNPNGKNMQWFGFAKESLDGSGNLMLAGTSLQMSNSTTSIIVGSNVNNGLVITNNNGTASLIESNATSTALYLTAAGVGIGTSAPASPLSFGGVTNYINFAATNTAPASAAAPVTWVTVTVQGTVYRMPLYQ